jgi:hypothetical protein
MVTGPARRIKNGEFSTRFSGGFLLRPRPEQIGFESGFQSSEAGKKKFPAKAQRSGVTLQSIEQRFFFTVSSGW